MQKPVIYQILPRLWGKSDKTLVKRGSLEENGCGKMSDIDGPTLDYIKWLGCNYVWLTGMIRHATKSASNGCIPSHPQFVKGEAGSPYSITDYYDVNPYLADNPQERMAEFDDLIKRVHNAGLKVIIDFVPNHVSRDYGKHSQIPGGLGADDDKSVHWSENNDFFYYPGLPLTLPNNRAFQEECRSLHSGEYDREYAILPAWMVNACKRGEDVLSRYESLLRPYGEMPAMATGNNYTHSPGKNDWYETIKINYCDFHTATWDKMLDILKFWLSKGVDGFRCDMVELVPAEFFKWAIAEIKELDPEIIFIAEVYKKDMYRKYIREVGFDLLYDKSGLYDSLRAIVEANVNERPVELWQSACGITRNWQCLGDLQPYMLNFLENHDEQRFASDFFGKSADNEFAALSVSLNLNRAAFMIYAGEELGERGMDNEGFSGRDGRTTIFDWWRPSSYGKLWDMIHSGAYRKGSGNAFFDRFSGMTRFASADDAVCKGMTYDLCYCNSESEGFDLSRHFAFLRDCQDETLLFVANFSLRPATMRIRIPAHAFEWLELPMTEALNDTTSIEVSVPPMDAVKIKLTTEK